MSNYRTVLMNAFDVNHRSSMTRSISQAYLMSAERSREFGVFYREALLEKTAINLGLDFHAAPNAARNCRHLSIKSNNWTLTAHHVSGPGQLPRKARYRAAYAQSMNYDLFEGFEDNDNVLPSIGGHVYLLHDGVGASLEAISLTIPTPDLRAVLYAEPLELVSSFEVEEETIEDELDEKIALRVDELLRKQK